MADPTFLLLVFIWHAVYAWDEALQHLYDHILRLVRIIMFSTSRDHEHYRLHATGTPS